MKKLLALCISVVTMLSLSLSLLASPVSAELYYSDREEYDLHISVEGSDSDVYLKFTDDSLTHGIWYEFTNIYTSVYITVSDASTGDALVAALGEEPSDITEEGQYVFSYDDAVDYAQLYEISGVEKVELGKYNFQTRFSRGLPYNQEDEWIVENIEEGSVLTPLLMSIVEMEEGVEPTYEMFADTGYTVQYICPYESLYSENEWCVYYDLVDLNSYFFDVAAMQVDGVVSSSTGFNVLDGTETLVLDEVTPPVTSAETICGDVNLDGSVDICDAVLIQQYMADSVTLGEQQTTNGDCNGDGVITAEDSASLLRFLLCITDTLPET